jgi:hypothetical protein
MDEKNTGYAGVGNENIDGDKSSCLIGACLFVYLKTQLSSYLKSGNHCNILGGE